MSLTIHDRLRLPASFAPVLGLATALMLSACGGADQTAPAAMAALTASAPAASNDSSVLTLPLEVLGNGSPRQPVIVEAGLGVASGKLGEVAQLWFQCHRCGFYGAPEFEAASELPVKIKAMSPSCVESFPWWP